MPDVRFHSVFDIIGPVMVGPSSSHTAGAARIGKVVRDILAKPRRRLRFTFMNHLPKPIAVMVPMWR